MEIQNLTVKNGENGCYTLAGQQDPKDHKVTVNLTMSANDYNTVKSVLPTKYFDELETRREINIMNEVMKMPGKSITEKADYAIAMWSNQKQETVRTNVRYKLKYRY